MNRQRITRTRWPKGTWMRLISPERLRAQMLRKDVSYQDLADAAGVSKGFISHLCRGRKKTMTPRVADAIARRLDMDLELLFVPSISIDSARPVQQRKVAA